AGKILPGTRVCTGSPISMERLSSPQAAQRKQRPYPGITSLNVLVCHPDVARRLALDVLLQLRQHQVTLAERSEASRRGLATSGLCELVVLEWDESAASLCAEIRSSQGERPVVVAVGAADTHEATLAALDAGADEALPSDFQAPEFRARLTRGESRAHSAI